MFCSYSFLRWSLISELPSSIASHVERRRLNASPRRLRKSESSPITPKYNIDKTISLTPRLKNPISRTMGLNVAIRDASTSQSPCMYSVSAGPDILR